MNPLFPRLRDPDDAEALRVSNDVLSYRAAAGAAAAVAARLAGIERVAVWADPAFQACVGVLGGLAAGAPVVPINPRSSSRELEHIVADSSPTLVLTRAGVDLPAALAALPRYDVALGEVSRSLRDELGPENTALILSTSGTTGLPKGVQVPRRSGCSLCPSDLAQYPQLFSEWQVSRSNPEDANSVRCVSSVLSESRAVLGGRS